MQIKCLLILIIFISKCSGNLAQRRWIGVETFSLAVDVEIDFLIRGVSLTLYVYIGTKVAVYDY